MKTKLFLLVAMLLMQFEVMSQPLKVIVFGAHPDDCDINVGGVATMLSQMGHNVKFVSLTNGEDIIP